MTRPEDITRRVMIDALIQGDIETNSGGGDWYLAGILRGGFAGYNDLSDEELEKSLGESFVTGSEDENAEESDCTVDWDQVRILAKKREND